MKNLLVGNGFNIQFDRKHYTNSEIIYRILKNCEAENFPKDVIIDEPYLIKCYIGLLYKEVQAIINGDYDKYTTCTAERKSLEVFKKRYLSCENLIIMDIGFEDYYLIHDMLCHKQKIYNPEQFNIREALKLSYLHAIYNGGKVNELYISYPTGLIEYLKEFHDIYTTNYDLNIDSVVDIEVTHLHGQFNKLAEVYNPDSFRNQLIDRPIDNININDNYMYLYSNALSTHCGEYKEHQIRQASLANEATEKIANLYKESSEIKREIDKWTFDDNKLVANLGSAIKLKVANPSLKYEEYYSFDKFSNIQGCLEIIGLSPWNDTHIFETLDNSNLEKCTYYYHSEDQIDAVRSNLKNMDKEGKLTFVQDEEFWSKVS